MLLIPTLHQGVLPSLLGLECHLAEGRASELLWLVGLVGQDRLQI